MKSFKRSSSTHHLRRLRLHRSFQSWRCRWKICRKIIDRFTCLRLLPCRYGFMTINIPRRHCWVHQESVNHSQICVHIVQSSPCWFSGSLVLLSASPNKKTSSRRSFEKIKFRKINWIKFPSQTLCYLYKNLNLFSFHVLLLFFPFLRYPKLHMKESHWKFI